MISREERRLFDELVERILAELPPQVRALLDEVPLYVDDRPSRRLMRELDIEYPEELCGCFSGRAIDERNDVNATGPDCVMIFRLGLLELATDDDGILDVEELRKQIRITILHELGHYHGMDEREIEEWGYA